MLVAALPAPASGNPWLERRVLNIAHQGGELEAPSNTLFAFKTAKAKGADVLELDVYATRDRELVVIHDTTVDRTTDGTGRVDQMTLDELKRLDAAHWFVPDCGTCHGQAPEEYSLRGYATGAREIPAELAGFEANDFRIPTLREVLETFPEELINIEIKRTAPDTIPYEQLLAELLNEFGRGDDTIVVSFYDAAVEAFQPFAPQVSVATATGETAAFWATAQGPAPGAPNPRYHALQVPISQNGVPVTTPSFVQRAHDNNLAVHVWTINDAATMEELIDMGVDGIMTDRPTLLAEVLARREVGHRSGCGASCRRAPRAVEARTSQTRARPHRFVTRGRVVVPVGMEPAQACAGGRVAVQVKRRRTTISNRQVSLRDDCSFRSAVTFREPRRLGQRRVLRFTARFLGSERLAPARAGTQRVRARPRA